MTALAEEAGERGYETVHDPAELRTAIRELRRVRDWIGQFADVAAELPGFAPEHVLAAKASTTAVVNLLIDRATARLDALAARRPPGVTVLDPERRRVLDTASGLILLPVVTEPEVATVGLSSAVLRLDPGEATVPHAYPDDTIIVVVFGALDLTWWDGTGLPHRAAHRRHQHAHIRRGTRHVLANRGSMQAVAVQVRATADVTAGVALLPDHPEEA